MHGKKGQIRGIGILSPPMIEESISLILRHLQQPVTGHGIAVQPIGQFFETPGLGVGRPAKPRPVKGNVFLKDAEHGFFLFRGIQVDGIEHHIAAQFQQHALFRGHAAESVEDILECVRHSASLSSVFVHIQRKRGSRPPLRHASPCPCIHVSRQSVRPCRYTSNSISRSSRVRDFQVS